MKIMRHQDVYFTYILRTMTEVYMHVERWEGYSFECFTDAQS
jgi:hypothetical protein